MSREKEKIDPKLYSKILKGIEFKKIYLTELKSEINHDLLQDNIKINIEYEAEYKNFDTGFNVIVKYHIDAVNKNDETAIHFDIIYNLEFNSESEISEGFFEIYKDLSLPLNVWPFVRELVNSVTSRMYIPPLTLPLFKDID